jgi:uncharacterized membrane protein YqiK
LVVLVVVAVVVVVLLLLLLLLWWWLLHSCSLYRSYVRKGKEGKGKERGTAAGLGRHGWNPCYCS